MSNEVIISDDNFTEEVIESNIPVLVDFWAEWCGPCKMIAPLMYEIDEQNDNIVVMKIDVDEGEEISAQCDIECMPTFLFYQKNEIEPFDKFSGADPQKLVTTINNILSE